MIHGIQGNTHQRTAETEFGRAVVRGDLGENRLHRRGQTIGLPQHSRGVLAVADDVQVINDYTVVGGVGHVQLFCIAVVLNLSRRRQTDLRGACGCGGEVSLPQNVHGAHAACQRSAVVHKNAVVRHVRNEHQVTRHIDCNARRGAETDLRGGCGVAVEVRLPKHVIGKHVERSVARTQVIDQYAVIRRIRHVQAVVNRIDRYALRHVHAVLTRAIVRSCFCEDGARRTQRVVILPQHIAGCLSPHEGDQVENTHTVGTRLEYVQLVVRLIHCHAVGCVHTGLCASGRRYHE